MTTLGMNAAGLYALAREAKSKAELEQIERDLWRDWAEQRIGDDEANEVAAHITRLKGGGQIGRAAGAVTARLNHRLVSRQRPRCPNRAASRARRRQLGGSGALPDSLRHHYTEGQRAVLTIIVGEVREKGHCELPIDKIAALAGVCRTTVQTTLHEARRLGHIIVRERPQPGRKSLTNVVEVASREWLAWIRRGSLKAARDRVQFAHAVRKGEPHEEQRGIEDGRPGGEERARRSAGGGKGDMVTPFASRGRRNSEAAA